MFKSAVSITTTGLIWILLALLFCLAFPLAFTQIVRADSTPSIPEDFYGTVSNNGATVGAGYVVTAEIGSTVVASTITNASGKYGYSPQFAVSGTSGQSIVFYVNCTQAQTASFNAGATNLNLVVTGAPATPPAGCGATTATTTTTNPLSITTPALYSGMVGTVYSQTLAASGGSGSYTFSLGLGSGPLPSGLGINSSGAISGTPTTAGTYSFTIQVEDSTAATYTKPLSITVASATSSSVTPPVIPTITTPSTSTSASTSTSTSSSTASSSSNSNGYSGSYPTSTYTEPSTPASTPPVTNAPPATAPATTAPAESAPAAAPSQQTQASAPGFLTLDMAVAPQVAAPGQQVDVTARLVNTGETGSTATAVLKINGIQENQQETTLEPGKSQVVDFQVTKSDIGTYSVDINGQTSSFQVQPGTATSSQPQNGLSQTTIYIIFGAGLLIIIILIILIARQRSGNY